MGTDIVALCKEMIAIPSVSHDEENLAGFVANHLSQFSSIGISRIGNNVIAKSSMNRPNRVIIAGHLDTVPADDNLVPRLEDGRIYGLGSADMKSGLAVMLGLAEIAGSFSFDTTFIFYACEEVATSFSGLLEIERVNPDVFRGDVAVLMEPSSSRIEAGCQGTMRVEIIIRGQRAHTARPWVGVNAIHRAAGIISRLAEVDLGTSMIDSLQFRESLQVVKVHGGVANNVVPDLATIVLNYRFAPNKTVEEAFEFVKSLVENLLDQDGDEVVLEEGVLGALPNLSDPFISRLREASSAVPNAKLGWTDVAFFVARGIPATNFGPGDPLLAHTKNEFVEVSEIELAFTTMRNVLSL
ncbi:MAG: succinyl-diaminopimelate desuccinylase [Actinomycetota bacterium]|nr:succinyl-diaminopimelate desuccinylase [Actinomycetota bacterium]